jgi:hypothetical protein
LADFVDKEDRRFIFCHPTPGGWRTLIGFALLKTRTSTSSTHDLCPLPSRRALNFCGLIAVTFFCVAGGAFGLEDAVAAGGPLIVLLTIPIVRWLWNFPTAVVTAELSTAMPEDSGYGGVVYNPRSSDSLHGVGDGASLCPLLGSLDF